MKELKDELTFKLTSFEVLEDRHLYVNPTRVFFAYFACLPNNLVVVGVNDKKAFAWMDKNYKNEIAKIHGRKVLYPKKREYTNKLLFYLFKDEMLVKIDQYGDVLILYSDKSEARAEKLSLELRKFRNPRTPCLYTLVDGGNGFRLTDITSKKPKLSITSHYNDDFEGFHKTILKNLKKKNQSGLFLLHGAPGTGKTTYIKYLIHSIPKDIIFLPPKLAASMDSPSLLNVLIEQPNSVIIVEDAEDIIASRDSGNNTSISTLLNLTDGMLGESLGIQFICTFNTSLKNIDKALLRKGRLKAIYEFKALAPKKARLLLEKLGNAQLPMREDLTLADIFNIEENGNSEEKKKIGFSYRS